jgi:toxin ParE1/3/4
MGAKKQLEWSQRSLENVIDIEEYISLENPAAARKVTAAIVATAEQLRNQPKLGRTGRRAGTRELVVARYPYFISYRLTARKITVVAVIHQSRKYP